MTSLSFARSSYALIFSLYLEFYPASQLERNTLLKMWIPRQISLLSFPYDVAQKRMRHVRLGVVLKFTSGTSQIEKIDKS